MVKCVCSITARYIVVIRRRLHRGLKNVYIINNINIITVTVKILTCVLIYRQCSVTFYKLCDLSNFRILYFLNRHILDEGFCKVGLANACFFIYTLFILS